MKERIFNALLMVIVLLSLGIALHGGEAEPAQMTLALTAPPTPLPTSTPHPVAAYRLQRQQERMEESQWLKAVLASDGAENRAEAERQLLQMASQSEIELAVEGALAGYGYAQAVCVARQGKLTVILAGTLSEQEARAIWDLVQEISDAAPENIRIIDC